MATLTPTFAAQQQPEGVVYQRVPPARREEALSLLLTGAVGGSRAVVEQFLGYARDQSLSLDHLWGAYRGQAGSILASALLVHCAGRTAMSFVSPRQAGMAVSVSAGLIRAVCGSQDPQRVRVVQGLLDPAQVREAEAFHAAGFRRLACLVYMQRASAALAPRLTLPADIEAIQWQPDRHELFAQTILATYEDTADCPGLLGLREIGDVLDGHMATGEFVPRLWLALRSGGNPVGVMLLNPVLNRQSMEVVYLGLAKPWRGRGLGRQLMLHGIGLARQERIKNLILAVDESNRAAMKLYESLQFTPTARKLAMLWPVAAV